LKLFRSLVLIFASSGILFLINLFLSYLFSLGVMNCLDQHLLVFVLVTLRSQVELVIPKSDEMKQSTGVYQSFLLLDTFLVIVSELAIFSSTGPFVAFLHLWYPSSYQDQYVFLIKGL
jgi:hypothetical protein